MLLELKFCLSFFEWLLILVVDDELTFGKKSEGKKFLFRFFLKEIEELFYIIKS